MRTAQLERGEIEIEARLQFLAVPGVSAEKLLVVRALLVPMRQERTGEVESLPIPTLRDHVDLFADLFLVNLFRMMRIGNVEDAALAVAETTDKQCLVVSAQADIDWEHAAFNVTHRRDLLCLPLAAIVRVDEPKLRAQRSRGKSVVVLVAPRPADFERRTRHPEHFFWLTSMEIPHYHRVSEMFHRLGIGSHFAEVRRVIVPPGEG